MERTVKKDSTVKERTLVTDSAEKADSKGKEDGPVRTRKRGTATTIDELAEQRRGSGKTAYRFDCKNAVELIREAIEKGLPIKIIGDYDCDGVCASAILYMTLMKLGVRAKVRLPLRFAEGYGMNEKMVEETDSGLLITVDNGITALDAARLAKEKGLTLLMTDHHLPAMEDGKPVLPVADCLIDPHVETLLGDTTSYDFDGYCGAGVALKLAERLLGETIGLEADKRLLEQMYALAAVATVADHMDLTEDNREICRRGIAAMVRGDVTAGLRELLCNNRKDFSYGVRANVAPWMLLTGGDLGFYIGPSINAPSRMSEEAGEGVFHYVNAGGDGAKISFMCLVNEDSAKAKVYADELRRQNDARKSASSEGKERAIKAINERGLEKDSPLVLELEGMKPGLIGNIAGALCQEYGVPVVLLTNGEEGLWHGSCRSPEGYHILQALSEVADLLENFGGHAGAAGVSLREEMIPVFRQKMVENGGFRVPQFEELEYDLEIRSGDVPHVMEVLEQMGPFGNGNDEPVFLLRDMPVQASRILNYNHVKLKGDTLDAIAFGKAVKGELPPLASGSTASMIGRLGLNYYRGSVTTQLQVEDFV